MAKHKRAAILLAGGSGRRMGAATPKQLLKVGGRTILEWCLSNFANSNLFDWLAIVVAKQWQKQAREAVGELGSNVNAWVDGGETRQQSSYRGLKSFAAAGGGDFAFIHDVARPFTPHEVLERLAELVIEKRAAGVALPVNDSLWQMEGSRVVAVPPREGFQRAQTPQAFAFELILSSHRWAISEGIEDASDDLQLIVRRGLPAFAIAGSEDNLKITQPADLRAAEMIIARRIQGSATRANADSARQVSPKRQE